MKRLLAWIDQLLTEIGRQQVLPDVRAEVRQSARELHDAMASRLPL